MSEWASYGNYCKVTQNPHFLEKGKRGDQGKFFKNRPKSSPRLKGPKALWRKWHYPIISMHLNCKDWKRSRSKQPLQKCPNDEVMKFSQGHPKPAFSEKVQRGDQGKFLKNRPKSSLRLKGPKALGRKWHYLLTCILLKCENWRRFRRKQRLQKCPNGQVIAIFARSPKTRLFWKSAKEGPREIFQKSPKT